MNPSHRLLAGVFLWCSLSLGFSAESAGDDRSGVNLGKATTVIDSSAVVAVKRALDAYRGRSPEQVAKYQYSKAEYFFILTGGFSLGLPGDFRLGADLMVRRFPTRLFPTSDDAASDEEAKVFAEAIDFAKRFNEALFDMMVEGGQLVVHEIEYLVKEDVGIVVDYLTGDTLTLRGRVGERKVVWLDKPDGLSVTRGEIELLRNERVTAKQLKAARM